MKIHLLSDVHLEFEDFAPAITEADVTILAGDIAPKLAGLKWALKHFPGRVLYVCGNHEFYGTELDRNFEKLQALARSEASDRVQILNREAVVIDGVRFLCGTGWTDFQIGGDPELATLDARNTMSDYRKIRLARKGYRRLDPLDTMRESQEFKIWLQRQLEQPFDGKTVVITHHAPSAKSLPISMVTNPLDAAYASNWHDLMKGVDLWVHGHTHKASDYQIEDCRVVCNAKGYPGQFTGFEPGLVIEI